NRGTRTYRAPRRRRLSVPRIRHREVVASRPHGNDAHAPVAGDFAEVGARTERAVGQLPNEAVTEEAVKLLDGCHDFDRHPTAGAAAPLRDARRRCIIGRGRRHAADVLPDHVGDGLEPVQTSEPRVHEHDVLGATATKNVDATIRIAFEPGFAVHHETLFGRHESTSRDVDERSPPAEREPPSPNEDDDGGADDAETHPGPELQHGGLPRCVWLTSACWNDRATGAMAPVPV